MKRLLRPFAPIAVVTIAAALSFVGATAARASNAVPYTDPNAVGYIGLCNKAGQQITHGDINTTPLAWRAVSSTAAVTPYNEPGRTATLLAYQPRQGLAPGEWSGEEITSSSRYTNAAHPMVAATGGDDSLAYFTSNFHPAWGHLVQLRIYLGAPNEPPYSYKYPALDLKVTGNSWTAVDGGPVNCHSGTSESIETILLHPSSAPTSRASSGATSTSGASAHPTTSPNTGGATRSPSPGGVSPSSSDAADSASSSSSSHAAAITIVIVAVIVVLALASYLVTRRRRLAPADAPPPSTEGPSGKGH